MNERGLGKLLHGFNRSAKRVLIAGVAAVSLIAGFNAEARVHEQPGLSEPSAVALLLLEEVQQPQAATIKYAYSEERLDKIKANMELTDIGRALLAFAADENISLEMSSARVMDDSPRDNITIKGLNYSTLIRLNGDITSDDEIMITLAHEIRHSWHERRIKSDALALTPRNEWLKRRIQEADCFAFEIHFAFEYEKATGKTLSLGDRHPPAGQATYASMLGDYTRQRGNKNKTVGDAYSALLAKAFAHVNRQGYDRRFVAGLSQTWMDVAAKPALQPAYAGRMVNPAPDAEFVAAMRLVATAGLKPGEDPAALTAWLDADFLGFDKTGGKPSRANMTTFNSAQQKYDAAKLAWKELTEKPAAEPPAAASPPEKSPPPAPVTPAAPGPIV